MNLCATFAPAITHQYNGLWCNGNTTDFGSVILGSSPSRPTKASQETGRLFLLRYF